MLKRDPFKLSKQINLDRRSRLIWPKVKIDKPKLKAETSWPQLNVKTGCLGMKVPTKIWSNSAKFASYEILSNSAKSALMSWSGSKVEISLPELKVNHERFNWRLRQAEWNQKFNNIFFMFKKKIHGLAPTYKDFMDFFHPVKFFNMRLFDFVDFYCTNPCESRSNPMD